LALGARPTGGIAVFRRFAAIAIGLWTAGLPGCAAQQIVPLSIEPAPVEVFVDGRLAASGQPESLSLRVDRSHVVLVRRAGYQSRQVVLESVRQGGEVRLTPDAIALRLVPERSQARRLQVELDPADDVPEPAVPAPDLSVPK
jgi:hypothetical protein